MLISKAYFLPFRKESFLREPERLSTASLLVSKMKSVVQVIFVTTSAVFKHSRLLMNFLSILTMKREDDIYL